MTTFLYQKHSRQCLVKKFAPNLPERHLSHVVKLTLHISVIVHICVFNECMGSFLECHANQGPYEYYCTNQFPAQIFASSQTLQFSASSISSIFAVPYILFIVLCPVS